MEAAMSHARWKIRRHLLVAARGGKFTDKHKSQSWRFLLQFNQTRSQLSYKAETDAPTGEIEKRLRAKIWKVPRPRTVLRNTVWSVNTMFDAFSSTVYALRVEFYDFSTSQASEMIFCRNWRALIDKTNSLGRKFHSERAQKSWSAIRFRGSDKERRKFNLHKSRSGNR